MDDITSVFQAGDGIFRSVKKNAGVDVSHGGDIPSTVVPLLGITDNNITNIPLTGGTGGFDHLVNDGIGPSAVDAETGTTAIDPIWHATNNPTGALRYIVRTEPNNSISGKGAEVMLMKGKSGTLWGDAGFDDDLDIPMWPIPMGGYCAYCNEGVHAHRADVFGWGLHQQSDRRFCNPFRRPRFLC